ncbi:MULTISPECIES: hypothetical protein [unclassified Leptolyngbya]|uniref:hypothetical protein n=1 Tax=unclassified Leptolyngbya TaxID=2650499 RepID=UPI001685BE92|nr:MULTISPECIES: hypothetical protein [unclassified Leptolyngbya]MBD1909762.1 hypothetical protein [Leptolyngbya sp. FACHB-8]MBD2157660.1 hypothetical protein [Leptolyngbya sp. FACHB-16]
MKRSIATMRNTTANLLLNPLYTTLLTMLQGDRHTTDRLIQTIRITYPHQSKQWWYEKAIDQVMRDRPLSR